MLEARFFGQFDLCLDGKPVEIRSRPAQSLLAFLLLHGGIAYRREKLAGMFWLDYPEAEDPGILAALEAIESGTAPSAGAPLVEASAGASPTVPSAVASPEAAASPSPGAAASPSPAPSPAASPAG